MGEAHAVTQVSSTSDGSVTSHANLPSYVCLSRSGDTSPPYRAEGRGCRDKPHRLQCVCGTPSSVTRLFCALYHGRRAVGVWGASQRAGASEILVRDCGAGGAPEFGLAARALGLWVWDVRPGRHLPLGTALPSWAV